MHKGYKTERFPYLLPALFGLISTLLYYRYGMWDSVETIALVRRTLDASYLQGDFLLQARGLFHIRFYFVWLLTGLAALSSVPIAFFITTLGTNILTAIASFRFGRSLGQSLTSGLLASALVMSASTAGLSQSASLYTAMAIPSALAAAFVFFALEKALQRKTLAAGLFMLPSILLQPQYALTAAGLIFVPALLSKSMTKKALLQFVLVGLLLALALLPNLIPYLAMPQLADDRLFIHILVHYRHPHHFLPSVFLNWTNVAILIGMALALWVFFAKFNLNNDSEKAMVQRRFIGFFLLIMALYLFAGWFFVEVIPVRHVASLQLWRNTDLLKWLFLVCSGALAGRLISREEKLFQGMVLALSFVNIWLVFPAWIVVLIGKSIKRGSGFWQKVLWYIKRGLHLLLVLYLLYTIVFRAILQYQEIQTWQVFALAMLAGLSFYLHKKRVLAGVFFLVMLAGAYFFLHRPYSLHTHYDAVHDIALKTKSISPPGSLLCIPPGTARIRLIAERPLVVDYRGVVTENHLIGEWYERMMAIYGPLGKGTSNPLLAFGKHYKNICDGDLFVLSQKYGVDYAILYAQTNTVFPVLASNAEYKLVMLR